MLQYKSGNSAIIKQQLLRSNLEKIYLHHGTESLLLGPKYRAYRQASEKATELIICL